MTPARPCVSVRKRFAALALLPLVGAGLGWAEPAPVRQVLFDFEPGCAPWSTNVWGGPGTIALAGSEAPKFGAGALHAVLRGVARGGNTISPWLPEDAHWRQFDWGAVSLWFKGDGSPTKAVLRVQTGEGTRVDQDYSCDLPMDSTDWRRFILPVASFWNRGRVAMASRRILRCYIGHSGDHSFEVDQIALEASQRAVPLVRAGGGPGTGLAPELVQFGDGRHGVRFDPSGLLPGPAAVRAGFQFPGSRTDVTETFAGVRPSGEALLLAPPTTAGGSSRLLIEVSTAPGRTVAGEWRFDAVLNRPLPSPTRLSLLPAPKECQLGEGAFPLSAGMEIAACGAEAGMAARILAEDLGHIWPDLRIVDAPVPDGEGPMVRLAGGGEPSPGACERVRALPAGGYRLDAGPRGATVRARNPEGLRNGVLTLLQAAESQWALTGRHALPHLQVVDWPNLPIRAVSVSLPNARWGHPNDPPADPDSFLRYLRETVLRTKMNLVVLIVEQAMRFETHPEVSGPAAWTKQDLRRVFDTLRGWGVEPVPCMNSLGHMNWLCIPRRDLAEEGDVHQICTRHPQAAPVVQDLYRELIEIARPKYFHAGLDEIRWQSHRLPAGQRCPRCASHRREDLFVEWVQMLHGFFENQGIRMMMWGDMILAGHNGGPPYRLSATAGRLPKDIVVCNWSTRLLPGSAQELRHLGFNQIIKANSGGATLAEQPLLNGNMFGCWYKVPWLTEGTEPHLEGNAYGAFLQAAEYSWNHWTDPFDPMPPLQAEFFAERPLVQMRIGADPVRGGRLQPVQLPQPGPVSGLPDGLARFGHASFEVKGGRVPGAGPGEQIEVAVGRRAAAVYLLHGARLTDRTALVESLKRREHWQGVPIAEYQVRYASGGVATIPVRYPLELRDPEPGWCVAPIAYGSLGVWPAQPAEAAGMHVYPLQWRNPRPEDPVVSVTLRQRPAPAQIALAGIVLLTPEHE